MIGTGKTQEGAISLQKDAWVNSVFLCNPVHSFKYVITNLDKFRGGPRQIENDFHFDINLKMTQKFAAMWWKHFSKSLTTTVWTDGPTASRKILNLLFFIAQHLYVYWAHIAQHLYVYCCVVFC